MASLAAGLPAALLLAVSLPLGTKALSRSAVAAAARQPRRRPPNVLYLLGDDMRPQMASYGQTYMKTPNLDSLAASGLQFDSAYANIAVCAPSRNSFLSGRRPDRSRTVNFMRTFRDAEAELKQVWESLPEFFKLRGYFTSGAGKVYHDGMDDPRSWSFPSNPGRWILCQEGDVQDPDRNYCGVTNASRVKSADEEEIMNEGLKRMRLGQASGQPWFVAIGFHRPHWPWRVPAGFHGPELYPGDAVKPPKYPQMPDEVPYVSAWYQLVDSDIDAVHDKGWGCRDCVVPRDRALEYRRWYYASVTWIDHCVGRALRLLEDLGVADNTIVVFHSDHGFHLGEMNRWGKKTNAEVGTRVPLIIRAPWKKASAGQRTAVKAELVDIYRTLADLAGLGGVDDSVDGQSLATLFDDPRNPTAELQQKVAYSQIGRCACHGGRDRHGFSQCQSNACCDRTQWARDWDFMGYSVRNAGWRYTAWVPWDGLREAPNFSRLASEGLLELYDLRNDTGDDFDFPGYTKNLAQDPQHSLLMEEFATHLEGQAATWGSCQLAKSLLKARRNAKHRYAQFKVIGNDDGSYSFKTWFERFVSASSDGSVEANHLRAGGDERFTVHRRGNGSVSLQASSGKFVRVAQDGTVRADSPLEAATRFRSAFNFDEHNGVASLETFDKGAVLFSERDCIEPVETIFTQQVEQHLEIGDVKAHAASISCPSRPSGAQLTELWLMERKRRSQQVDSASAAELHGRTMEPLVPSR